MAHRSPETERLYAFRAFHRREAERRRLETEQAEPVLRREPRAKALALRVLEGVVLVMLGLAAGGAASCASVPRADVKLSGCAEVTVPIGGGTDGGTP